MTIEEAEKLVAAYEALCERASKIWCFDHDEYIRVWFQDGKAYAQSARIEVGYYGDGHVEAEQFSCEPELMLMSDEEFNAWLKAKNDERRREELLHVAAKEQERERQERAMYEHLRQKYGKIGIF